MNVIDRFDESACSPVPFPQPSPIDPNYTDQLTFEGLSVELHDASGKTMQGSMDATLAAKQAALNTMEYLCNLGYTAEQVHLLLSAAVRPTEIASPCSENATQLS